MPEQKLVKLTIDGQDVSVPEGTNIIEAAKQVEVDIPHYCYHPHLSVAGNCRICKVEIEGRPKLEIGCNTVVQEGMQVKTHRTSEKVAETQRATMEFLLINHPLDCTVCDQAGHCKLQDYYYEYNSKPSRFVEEKVNKVKAEVLGPNVIYDGERCILCTRCVRFCDEVTETGELGAFNRGDKAVIGINPGNELENPLSGTVVDLCPVGALTHRDWRFNTRVWYTDDKKSICAGCSTGCNVKVYERDNQIVQVKARENAEVNKEWLCDEGRYGFTRFQPSARLEEVHLDSGNGLESSSWDNLSGLAKKLKADADDAALFLSPFLTFEEIWAAKQFAEKVMKLAPNRIAVQLKQRELSETEKVLISPDYAPNARSVNFLGIGEVSGDWRAVLEKQYLDLVSFVSSGSAKRIVFVGDYSVLAGDIEQRFVDAVGNADVSVFLTPRGLEDTTADWQSSSLHTKCKLVLPTRTVNEKSGLMLNQEMRLQRLADVLTAPFGSMTEWMTLKRLAKAAGVSIIPENVVDDRGLYKHLAKDIEQLSSLSLMQIGEHGSEELRSN